MTAPPAASFEAIFGRAPEIRADAPGRVNLIGEHTDYNGGFVLPAAIPQRTTVQAAARDDRTVRLWSAQFADQPVIVYELGHETPDGGWADYVKGMTRVLGDGARLRGFDATIESDVPVGSGLSSSAALEIAAGRAIRRLSGLSIDDVALAVAARRAENDFVGAPVGIMDQMACSLGDTGSALFLDTRSLEYSVVPLPPGSGLIVINSGITHRHAGGEYVARRRECALAAERLRVRELRDVTDIAAVSALPEPLNRRARHVVSENQRVLDTVEALRRGDLHAVGRLFAESHRSMRDDFEISVPAVDTLVAIASGVHGVYGARMTGGGFGGSIVALADATLASSAAAEIVAAYENTAGHRGTILVPR